MSKHREQSLINRFEILKKCYPLLAEGSWDAVTIADLEKAISQTRGAIAYYHKNKQTLLNNLMNELFFPVFELSKEKQLRWRKCTITDFHKTYKTPFERVRDDLKNNYYIENPSRAIFNLFIQGSKHYEGFTDKVSRMMQIEMDYMSSVVGGRVNTLIDLNRVYIENIGHIFVESMMAKVDK
ncbi:MAG: TetR/AcrR family transcriptional regulator [Muribaculaceae bacterium]|nr:TetR/AcrR family transcriptional regulator [Muribaculaceae bacterium]